MSPQTLNDLLFLKANRRYWRNANIIDEIRNDPTAPDVESESEDDGEDV